MDQKWYDQQNAIANNFTAIAWDARGYGDSDDYEGALKFEDFSHDLVRLLDFKNIDKAHFVGLSMGARILMDFYPKYKDRVATLFLCDCFFDYKILSKDKHKEFIDLRQKPLHKRFSNYHFLNNHHKIVCHQFHATFL